MVRLIVTLIFQHESRANPFSFVIKISMVSPDFCQVKDTTPTRFPRNYKCGRSVKDVGKFTEGEVNNRAQRAGLGLCGQRTKGSRFTKWTVSFCPLLQNARGQTIKILYC